MKLLLISDLHYKSEGISLIPERNTKFGVEFLKRIQRRINEDIDIIIIAGDILDDGEDSNPEKDYIEIKKTLEGFNVKRYLVTFGNHDKNPEKFYEIFGKNKYFLYDDFLFYVFYDRYYEKDFCVRSQEEIEDFKKVIKENPNKKVIVIQHNIIYPKIESYYPFNIVESEKIHNLYRENNVFLSVSGHYHKGVELINKDGIYYFTLPALCEEPFKYFIFEIGSELKIKEQQLKNIEKVVDYHCHTEFGYCAEDVSMERVIERCKLFGIQKIYFTEHAGQLYLSPDEYWNYKFFEKSEILIQKRENKEDRIFKYIEKFKSLNSDIAGLGLEVEVNKKGKLTLLEEDRNFFELLVGAIHYLPDEWCISKKNTYKNFLWMVEKLIENKIDILAHPFRFFFRKNMESPKEIFKDVVRMLREGKVKAEINFHHYYPEIEFFKMCIEENVEIVFGSDSHNILEVGEFSKYFEFLKKLNL